MHVRPGTKDVPFHIPVSGAHKKQVLPVSGGAVHVSFTLVLAGTSLHSTPCRFTSNRFM